MPDRLEAGDAGLSNLVGFSAWTSSAMTDAMTLFEGLSSRRATAIHLWNGSSSVRYSVVDGTEVPGSRNLDMSESEILYISN